MYIEKPEKLDWAKWLDLYKIAVDEYHFQVRLNSGRSQFFLTLNSAMLAASLGIVRIGSGVEWIAPVAFAVGAAISLLSMKVVEKSHSYYRSIRRHKAFLEWSMGLNVPLAGFADLSYNTLALETTDQMRHLLGGVGSHLDSKDQRLRLGTVIFWIQRAFAIFWLLNMAMFLILRLRPLW